MKRIGNYVVEHEGGRWQVTCGDRIVGEHHNKWDAIREARMLNWQDVHIRKRPPAHAGGSEEPKSKWRRVI